MNKKSYLRRVRLSRTPADWLEAVMNFIFFLCGMLAVCCVVLISVYMVVSGVPAIHKIGIFKFLFGTKWRRCGSRTHRRFCRRRCRCPAGSRPGS